MSFFSKKQEVNPEDFWRDFYETRILNVEIGHIGLGSYVETIKQEVVKADSIFTDVDLQKLTHEFMAMYSELFALAWLHKFPKYAFSQSIFAYEYLHEKDRDDIWEGMQKYNTAIAESVTAGLGEKAIYISMDRFDLFKKQIEAAKLSGKDVSNESIECNSIARVINRQFAKKTLGNGQTIYFLVLALCHELGLDVDDGSGNFASTGLNKEANARLLIIIRGFYDGIDQSLDKIKIRN